MRTACFLVSVFMSVSLMSPVAHASVNDDQVTSQKIKEADGTSGQNTNSGSGVKTNHIQNGAVTDAKIAGLISASKISSAGLNADTVDGLHASAFAPATHAHAQADVTGLAASLAGKSDVTHTHKYGKVAIVAQSGGDYTDPVDAMSHVGEWCGAPSSLNPCLLKIMPGVYNLTSRILLQDHVDIEGSGEGVTQINGGIFLFLPYGSASCEIRSMTIEAGSFALELNGDFTVKLSNLTLIGGTGNSDGAMRADWGKVIMNNVTLESVGGYSAIFGQVNLTMTEVTTSSPLGCAFFGGNPAVAIYNSRIADGLWFYSDGALNVANTLINASSGITRCVNCFDSGFAPIVCP